MKELAIPLVPPAAESCCGGPAAPPAAPHERPGYRLCPYVAGFLPSPMGPVPQLASQLSWRDRLGTLLVRLAIGRNGYTVAPGLYCLGRPDEHSPVLVTANYKLTFDCLRESLAGVSAWLLVLDTRGVNVWCAAAHQTFATAELVHRLQLCGLARVVAHRRLIVPQLAAPGVSAWRVLRESGFTVLWGPLRATDLPRFLANGAQIEPAMRELTFRLRERLVLIPVELALAIRPSLYLLAVIFGLAGIGPGIFSLAQAWGRWLVALPVILAGLLSGTVLVPLLLPWLPGRAFYRKGLLAALPVVALAVWLGAGSGLTVAALSCLGLAVSSYGALNFSGATPYASPSGVEKELRQGLPLQIALLLVALGCWVLAPFLGGRS